MQNDQDLMSSPNSRQCAVSRSNFVQSFLFPDEIFKFGKYKGKSMIDVINTDKVYFNWLIKEGLPVTKLILDYSNGIDIEQEKHSFSIDKKNDVLIIRSTKYYLLPKEKFIRGKDKKKNISTSVIATYKINIPFTIKVEHHSEYRDYTKFHNDGELFEWDVNVKKYEQPALNNFINECLRLNGANCFC